MLDRISFIMGEALIALRRNGFMTFAAISTVAVALFMLGGLGYVYYRAAEFADTIPGKFDMRVSLKDGTTMDGIKQTANEIRAIDGVASCSWIPKDKAWERKKQEDPKLTEGIENPFPDQFKVTVSDLKSADRVVESIKKLEMVVPGSDGVQYLREEQQTIEQILLVLRLLGSVGGGILFFTGGILIYNAIRLTVLSRRVEIRLMELVGASRFTIRMPFLIEGFTQGVLGGCVSALLVYGAQRALEVQLTSISVFGHLPPFPLAPAMALLGAVGGVYGLVCSYVAVRAPLRGQ